MSPSNIVQSQQEPDLIGLLYAFRFRPGEAAQPIDAETAIGALKREDAPDEFFWLHFNLAHAGAERWMRTHLELPAEFFETLHEGSRSTRIEMAQSALLAVVNDVAFDFRMSASDIATLWVCARDRLLVSARTEPLRSVDRLRSCVKDGECFRSSLELLVHLFRDQADVLTQIVRTTSVAVDAIEDRLLSPHMSGSRAELGAMRRVLVRLHRLLALEPAALLRLLNRPPLWVHEEDVRELRGSTEEFSLVINDLTALGERIRLVQEEVAAKLNEQTNRTLFMLTIVTVLALPINIIAGLFGMNVGGIPLGTDPKGFWILVAMVITFTALAGRWAFRKRNEY
jgi:zinc transporter